MNIFEQQAKAIQQVREVGKVIPFPTQEEAKALHARGLTVVHKPHRFKSRDFTNDDFPPEAA